MPGGLVQECERLHFGVVEWHVRSPVRVREVDHECLRVVSAWAGCSPAATAAAASLHPAVIMGLLGSFSDLIATVGGIDVASLHERPVTLRIPRHKLPHQRPLKRKPSEHHDARPELCFHVRHKVADGLNSWIGFAGDRVVSTAGIDVLPRVEAGAVGAVGFRVVEDVGAEEVGCCDVWITDEVQHYVEEDLGGEGTGGGKVWMEGEGGFGTFDWAGHVESYSAFLIRHESGGLERL